MICYRLQLVTSALLGLPGSGFVVPRRSNHQKYSSATLFVTTADKLHNNVFQFDDMKKLDQRLDVLEESSSEFLMDFYEPDLCSFSIQPGTASRISITSTCYSVQAILNSADPSAFTIELNLILKELLNSPWHENDIYQVSLITLTLLKSDPLILKRFDTETHSKISKLISLSLTARPKRRFGENQIFSEYIAFICCSVYAKLNKLILGDLPSEMVPEGAAAELSLALIRCREASFNEVCRQMAYRSAGDSSSFDVIRLVYSLLAYVRACKALEGTAGRETAEGKGPEVGTENIRLNKWLVKAALAGFFEEQQGNGLWDRGQPIYKSFRKQGRNIGNAYVFAVDALSSLFEIIPDSEYFRPHLGKLQKTLEWVESHQQVEIVPDFCDTESGQCSGRALRGWASSHLIQSSGPQAWSTAQTVTCISLMRKTIRKLMHSDVLKEFNGIAHSKQGPLPEAWDRLLDSDLGSPGVECRTIKCVLEDRVCTPFMGSIDAPGVGAAYSTILFGSPGTAKTTISEATAEKMGWDFVVIDTASFLSDGSQNVASRIRYVFTRLQALRECVILFDEIEEFCLDRETPGISMESRMLTTAMLTAINDLRRAKQSVFFLATNRLRAFDAAIIRPGRFDVQLFVGTPNLGSRVILFEQAISKLLVSEKEKAVAVDAYKEFLDSVWSEDAMFMNYLEGKQLASSAANILASGRKLDAAELDVILKQQAAVMTCRGTVRDEYKAQMGLSRL